MDNNNNTNKEGKIEVVVVVAKEQDKDLPVCTCVKHRYLITHQPYIALSTTTRCCTNTLRHLRKWCRLLRNDSNGNSTDNNHDNTNTNSGTTSNSIINGEIINEVQNELMKWSDRLYIIEEIVNIYQHQLQHETTTLPKYYSADLASNNNSNNKNTKEFFPLFYGSSATTTIFYETQITLEKLHAKLDEVSSMVWPQYIENNYNHNKSTNSTSNEAVSSNSSSSYSILSTLMSIPLISTISTYAQISRIAKVLVDAEVKLLADNVKVISTIFPLLLLLLKHRKKWTSYNQAVFDFIDNNFSVTASNCSDPITSDPGSGSHGEELFRNPFELDELLQSLTIEPFWYKYHPNLQKFREMLYVTYTALGESHKLPSSIRKHATTIATALQCTLLPEQTANKIQEVHNDLDISLLQSIWNLPDVPLISMVSGVTLPQVAVSQLITIPPPCDGPLQGMAITARVISAKPLPFSISHLIPTSSSYVAKLNRALSALALHSFEETDNSDHAQLSDEEHEINTTHIETPSLPLIFHIHGGGFVSGSSAMHENYLREWAIAVDCPILSIDYRLGPDFKYPTALLECYYAYKWVVNSCRLGMYVSKVAVVGDSAGGNIAATLTLKAIAEGVRLPNGVIMHYPVVDMTNTVYPSRFLFMNDPVVPCAAAKVCRDSYIPGSCNLRDPLISPLFARAEDLLKFPDELYLTVAQYDPLSDEAFLFAERMRSLKKIVHVKVYEGLPHGFLSTARYMPEANYPIQESGQWLKHILFNKE